MNDYEVSICPIDPITFGNNGLGYGGRADQNLNVSPIALHGAIGGFILKHAGAPGKWPQGQLGPRRKDILRRDEGSEAPASAQLRGFCFRDASGTSWFPKPQHIQFAADERAGTMRFREVSRPAMLFDCPDQVRSSCPYPRLVGGTVEDEYDGELLVGVDLLSWYLCGRSGGPKSVARPADVLVRDHSRIGIVMDNEIGRTVEGGLFERNMKRFNPGPAHPDGIKAGYRAWFRTPEPLPKFPDAAIGKLGGDGRRALLSFEERASPLDSLCQDVKDAAAQPTSAGFFLYLLTPAILTDAAIRAARQSPVAAAIGKTWRNSGWNVHLNEPRPFATMLPAGSVFFFRWPDDVNRNNLVDGFWLEPLPTDKEDEIDPALAGLGRTLVGVWS